MLSNQGGCCSGRCPGCTTYNCDDFCTDLADPTTVVVTDGSREAERDVLRERLRASRALDEERAS